MQPTIWVADGELGLFVSEPEGFQKVACALLWPHAPCPAGAQFFCACKERGVVQRFVRLPEGWQAEREFLAPPGLECMQASPDGAQLYLLSGEADSLSAVEADTGELLYGNAAGVYPRSLQMNATGRLLAVAGGAAGEVLLFSAPSLNLLTRIAVPGIACQAAFVDGGLAVLCAVEDGEVNTFLGYVGGGRTLVEEILLLPGLPGALKALPDGTVLAGSAGALVRVFNRQKRVAWQTSAFGLPGTLSVRGEQVLVSDPLLGGVTLMNWRKPREQRLIFQGGEVAAVFQGM